MSAMVSGVVLIAVLAALAALACVLALAAFRRAGAREHPRHDRARSGAGHPGHA